MANKINELKLALGAGARANKYRINFTYPSAVNSGTDLSEFDVLAHSTSFPGKTIGQIEVYNQGRKLVLFGDTQFQNTWTITVYNTEDHAIRRAMLNWMKACDNFQENKHSGVPAELMVDMSIEQLDSAGNGTAKYTFHNAWISEVADTQVADETQDTIQEFDITITYTDWVSGSDEIDNPLKANASTLNPTAL